MSNTHKSERLAPVARIADHRERAAAQEFGRLLDNLAEEELRLAEMRAWWVEYAQGLEQQPGNGSSVMREGRLFLAQLNSAIERQRSTVETARRTLEAGRARWLASRMDHEALEKIVARYRQEEGHAARRSEQREQDECAARCLRPESS